MKRLIFEGSFLLWFHKKKLQLSLLRLSRSDVKWLMFYSSLPIMENHRLKQVNGGNRVELRLRQLQILNYSSTMKALKEGVTVQIPPTLIWHWVIFVVKVKRKWDGNHFFRVRNMRLEQDEQFIQKALVEQMCIYLDCKHCYLVFQFVHLK